MGVFLRILSFWEYTFYCTCIPLCVFDLLVLYLQRQRKKLSYLSEFIGRRLELGWGSCQGKFNNLGYVQNLIRVWETNLVIFSLFIVFLIMCEYPGVCVFFFLYTYEDQNPQKKTKNENDKYFKVTTLCQFSYLHRVSFINLIKGRIRFRFRLRQRWFRVKINWV